MAHMALLSCSHLLWLVFISCFSHQPQAGCAFPLEGLTSWLYLHAQAGPKLAQRGLGTTLSPAEAPGLCQPYAFQSLAARCPEEWQLVLFSHPKSLPEELGPDPAPVLGLPGLALALIRAWLPFSANHTETPLGAKVCDEN